MRKLYIHNKDFCNLAKGDKFKIISTEYTILKTIIGGLGIVFFAKKNDEESPILGNISHGPIIVLKSIRPDMLNDKTKKDFFRELYNWSKFSHSSILPLHEVISGPKGELIALMDPMQGSLREFILRKKFNEIEIKHVANSVLAGLNYAQKYFQTNHLDIKPENILIGPSLELILGKTKAKGDFRDYRVLISDWGISSNKASEITKGSISTNKTYLNNTLNNSGTLCYMSPERFIKGFPSSESSDIYSLGIILIELVTGRLPFNILEENKILKSISNSEYYISSKIALDHSKTSNKLKSLILSMINPDLSRRVSIRSAIRKLNWFSYV